MAVLPCKWVGGLQKLLQWSPLARHKLPPHSHSSCLWPAVPQVALRGEPEDPVAVPLASMDAVHSAPAAAPNGNGRTAATRELPALLPMDQVPQLPQVGAGR